MQKYIVRHLAAAAIVLTGTVEPHLECPSIRLDDGRLVYLSELPSHFTAGDRVTVHGSGRAGDPTCQKEVVIVEKVSPTPAHRNSPD